MSEENRPTTMRDLEAAELQVVNRLTTVMDTKIDALESRISTKMQAMETNLLTAFHEWTRTYEVRVRGLGVSVRDFDERLGLIEERVSKLERRERPS